MNKREAYSTCKQYKNQYVNFRTTDGRTYQGYIGNVDRDVVYVQVPEKSARKLESSNSSRGGCGCRPPCFPVAPACCPPFRPPYPVFPGNFPPYSPYPTRPPYPTAVSPAATGPRPPFPTAVSPAAIGPAPVPPPPPAPVPVPVPVRRGWCWLGIPLAFLAGLWIGEVIN